jgi:hypothetical protein
MRALNPSRISAVRHDAGVRRGLAQARRRDKEHDGVTGQAYDRGANAALWLWQAQQRMKLAAK